MVMKTVYQTKNLPRYTQYFASDGTASAVTVNNGIWETVSLSGIISSKGDYKNPTAHSYTTYRGKAWTGAQYAYFGESNRSFQLTRGALGISFADRLPSGFSAEDSLAYNKAVDSMVEKIRGTMDLSVDLIQWRQAKQMLSLYSRGKSGLVSSVNNAFTSIALFEKKAAQKRQRMVRGRLTRFNTRDYERWYLRNARKLALQLAQRRLEYVYGIKPLCSTIVSISELIANPEKGGMVRLRTRGRVVKRTSLKIYSAGASFAPEVHDLKTNHFCTINVIMDPTPRVISNLSKISSLNPLSIAWEALPFSFVVDWFVGVGNWLRGVETAFLHGAAFRSGYVTRGWVGHDDMAFNDNSKTLIRQAQAYARRSQVSRTLLFALPIPRIPPFQMNLGSSQALNGLALLAVNASRVDGFIRSFAKK